MLQPQEMNVDGSFGTGRVALGCFPEWHRGLQFSSRARPQPSLPTIPSSLPAQLPPCQEAARQHRSEGPRLLEMALAAEGMGEKKERREGAQARSEISPICPLQPPLKKSKISKNEEASRRLHVSMWERSQVHAQIYEIFRWCPMCL